MCRPKSEGGQRCVAHARERLTSAVRAAQANPNEQTWHNVMVAEIEFASTKGGAEELTRRHADLVAAGETEAAATVADVLSRGEHLRERNAAVLAAGRAVQAPDEDTEPPTPAVSQIKADLDARFAAMRPTQAAIVGVSAESIPAPGNRDGWEDFSAVNAEMMAKARAAQAEREARGEAAMLRGIPLGGVADLDPALGYKAGMEAVALEISNGRTKEVANRHLMYYAERRRPGGYSNAIAHAKFIARIERYMTPAQAREAVLVTRATDVLEQGLKRQGGDAEQAKERARKVVGDVRALRRADGPRATDREIINAAQNTYLALKGSGMGDEKAAKWTKEMVRDLSGRKVEPTWKPTLAEVLTRSDPTRFVPAD